MARKIGEVNRPDYFALAFHTINLSRSDVLMVARNRPGVAQKIIRNRGRQGSAWSAKGHYHDMVVFLQTDCQPAPQEIAVPTFGMHHDDDQVLPCEDFGPLTVKWIKNATLNTYADLPTSCRQREPPRPTRTFSRFH